MNNKSNIKSLTAEDKELLGTRQYWDIMNYQGHGFVPITRMQYDKEQCEEIIQQILENQEKALQFDETRRTLSDLEDENKRLKDSIETAKQDMQGVWRQYDIVKQDSKTNKEIVEKFKSVLIEYGKEHNGWNAVNCPMCFNAKQIKSILEKQA